MQSHGIIMEHFLVIGSDKGIGLALYDEIAGHHSAVIRTTRRQDREGLLLDLAHLPENLSFGQEFSCAFICAAISSFADCELDPKGTFKVNVDGMLAVARVLLEKGCFVVFLSSSSVFDGSKPWSDEYSPRSPSTEYGRQKAIAEERLLEMDKGRERVAIVRLTKVLTGTTPVVARFTNQIQNGHSFEAFSDLRFSPVSMSYAVESLLKIAMQKTSGIYHLSGEVELSYAELARMMALKMKADPGIVREAGSSGTLVYFKPEFPGLGMIRTKEIAGLNPEPIKVTLECLLTEHQSLRR